MKMQSNNSVRFMDMVKILANKMGTQVIQIITHTPGYFHVQSHLHSVQNLLVMNVLVHRAILSSQADTSQTERVILEKYSK